MKTILKLTAIAALMAILPNIMSADEYKYQQQKMIQEKKELQYEKQLEQQNKVQQMKKSKNQYENAYEYQNQELKGAGSMMKDMGTSGAGKGR